MKRTSSRQQHTSHTKHNTSAPHPRILIACSDGRLCLGLAVLLSDITPNIDIVRSAEALELRVHQDPFDLIITRFVSLLVGSRSLPHRLTSEGRSTTFFALVPLGDSDHDTLLTLRLLEGGTSQVLSLPLSAERLHRKTCEEFKIHNC